MKGLLDVLKEIVNVVVDVAADAKTMEGRSVVEKAEKLIKK